MGRTKQEGRQKETHLLFLDLPPMLLPLLLYRVGKHFYRFLLVIYVTGGVSFLGEL